MDPGSTEAQTLKSDAGFKLTQDYMEILDDDDSWELMYDCLKCDDHFLTPFGLVQCPPSTEIQADQQEPRKLKVFTAGTVCVDVSMMGNRMALLGESSRSLAVFLALIKKAKPDLIVHECTSFFSQFLFDTFLSDYCVNRFATPENKQQRSALKAGFQSGTWLLSPHQFGWPAYRPRLAFGVM